MGYTRHKNNSDFGLPSGLRRLLRQHGPVPVVDADLSRFVKGRRMKTMSYHRVEVHTIDGRAGDAYFEFLVDAKQWAKDRVSLGAKATITLDGKIINE